MYVQSRIPSRLPAGTLYHVIIVFTLHFDELYQLLCSTRCERLMVGLHFLHISIPICWQYFGPGSLQGHVHSYVKQDVIFLHFIFLLLYIDFFLHFIFFCYILMFFLTFHFCFVIYFLVCYPFSFPFCISRSKLPKKHQPRSLII